MYEMPKSAGQASCICATGFRLHRLCATDCAWDALSTCSVAGKANRAWLPGRASERCTVRLSTCVAAPHSAGPLAATVPPLWPANWARRDGRRHGAEPPLPQAATHGGGRRGEHHGAGRGGGRARHPPPVPRETCACAARALCLLPFPAGHGHVTGRSPLTGRAGYPGRRFAGVRFRPRAASACGMAPRTACRAGSGLERARSSPRSCASTSRPRRLRCSCAGRADSVGWTRRAMIDGGSPC